MPRRIRLQSLQSAPRGMAPQMVDGYFDRIIKYIPSDIVGAWVAATGIIKTAGGAAGPGSGRILWVAFVVGSIATALWTWKQTSEPGRPPAYKQICLSTVAFVVWVVALGGPFATIEGYEDYYGSLLLIAYLLLAGLVA